MYRKIQEFIIYLLLGLLLSIVVSSSFGQQNQNTQEQEIEILKNRVSELEGKLQTVENVEKMELAAKLAEAEAKLTEANAKLMKADFGKFERELRDSNNKWLWGWTGFFVGVVAIIGIAFWFSVRSLIADRVEKNLNGFKKAVAQLEEIKNQLKVLQKEQAVSVLERLHHFDLIYDSPYHKQTEVLSEDALLDVFSDETRHLELRYKAAVVLADKKFVGLASLLLECLNSVVNSERMEVKSNARDLVNLLGQIKTPETYQGLKKFLNRLLTENLKNKDWFLTYTAFALADISFELEIEDSISILKKVLPDLKDTHQEAKALTRLAIYFDMFNESEAIKEILIRHVTSKMRGLETRCLKFLENHDPDFVRDWKDKKESANTESEES